MILLDTNVILDKFLGRDGYEEATKIIELIVKKQKEAIIASIVPDIHFLTKKNSDYTSFEIQDMISELIKYIKVLSVSENDIKMALKLRWKDFEDAVLYCTALSNNVDCIVTKNVKDFEDDKIEILTPKDFLSKYYAERER